MTPNEQFFYDRAGWSYGPNETSEQGRERWAKQLASAESDAELIGITFEWQQTPGPDLSWMDEEEQRRVVEILDCVAFNPVTKRYASLCDIADPAAEYRRVVQAQLAFELLK